MKTWIHKDRLHPVTIKTRRAQNSTSADGYEHSTFCRNFFQSGGSESPIEKFQLLPSELMREYFVQTPRDQIGYPVSISITVTVSSFK